MIQKRFSVLALALLTIAPMMFAQTPASTPFVWGPGLKVLIVSGGAWHEFEHWFGQADTATLNAAGITSVHYTENPDVAAAETPKADVVIMSANRPGYDTPGYRKALFDHVAEGKGLILVHSGVWHNWPWPEYDRDLIGGPSTSHDGKSPFQEHVVKQHPVTEGLPETFNVVDELYHAAPDPKGPGIDVLIEAVRGGTKYPSVWVVHNPKARIVGIALGHDGDIHNQAEYKKLICNAVNWTAGR